MQNGPELEKRTPNYYGDGPNNWVNNGGDFRTHEEIMNDLRESMKPDPVLEARYNSFLSRFAPEQVKGLNSYVRTLEFTLADELESQGVLRPGVDKYQVAKDLVTDDFIDLIKSPTKRVDTNQRMTDVANGDRSIALKPGDLVYIAEIYDRINAHPDIIKDVDMKFMKEDRFANIFDDGALFYDITGKYGVYSCDSARGKQDLRQLPQKIEELVNSDRPGLSSLISKDELREMQAGYLKALETLEENNFNLRASFICGRDRIMMDAYGLTIEQLIATSSNEIMEPAITNGGVLSFPPLVTPVGKELTLTPKPAPQQLTPEEEAERVANLLSQFNEQDHKRKKGKT